MKTKLLLGALMLALLAPAGWAEGSDDGTFSLAGWGPRVGFGVDPDQLIGGVHFDLGEIATNIALRPDVEIGLGDDMNMLKATVPAHYRFRLDSGVRPYAGAGVALGLVDNDKKKGGGTDFEVAIEAVGGFEWALKSRNRFFIELNLVIGDLHDAEILVGWVF